MTYTVWYGKGRFNHKLERVKGDGVLDKDYRWFILDDETRIELPRTYCFKFSKERFLVIQENMRKETGQL